MIFNWRHKGGLNNRGAQPKNRQHRKCTAAFTQPERVQPKCGTSPFISKNMMDEAKQTIVKLVPNSGRPISSRNYGCLPWACFQWIVDYMSSTWHVEIVIGCVARVSMPGMVLCRSNQ